MNFDAFYEHLLLYGTIQEFIKIMCKREDIQTLWLEAGLWGLSISSRYLLTQEYEWVSASCQRNLTSHQ